MISIHKINQCIESSYTYLLGSISIIQSEIYCNHVRVGSIITRWERCKIYFLWSKSIFSWPPSRFWKSCHPQQHWKKKNPTNAKKKIHDPPPTSSFFEHWYQGEAKNDYSILLVFKRQLAFKRVKIVMETTTPSFI